MVDDTVCVENDHDDTECVDNNHDDTVCVENDHDDTACGEIAYSDNTVCESQLGSDHTVTANALMAKPPKFKVKIVQLKW